MMYVRYVVRGMAESLSHLRIVSSVDRCCVCTMGGVAQKGNHRREHDYCVRYVTSVLRVRDFRLTIAEFVGIFRVGTMGGVVRHPARSRYEKETSAGAKEECYKRHVLICDAPEAVLMLRFFRRVVILYLIDCVDGRGLYPRTCYWSIDYVSWCKVYAKQDSNQRKCETLELEVPSKVVKVAREVWISPAGSKYHTSSQCQGLRNATQRLQREACLICASPVSLK